VVADAAGIAMAFKLIEAAQRTLRRLGTPQTRDDALDADDPTWAGGQYRENAARDAGQVDGSLVVPGLKRAQHVESKPGEIAVGPVRRQGHHGSMWL
jgi:hypothetical protein